MPPIDLRAERGQRVEQSEDCAARGLNGLITRALDRFSQEGSGNASRLWAFPPPPAVTWRLRHCTRRHSSAARLVRALRALEARGPVADGRERLEIPARRA